jgi:nucleoside-diphosphate-sugar epimerase
MRIVMIGGTGLLGWFTTAELAARGHDVVAFGLGTPPPGTIPAGVASVAMDVDAADPAAPAALLDGADVLVHAADSDHRGATHWEQAASCCRTMLQGHVAATFAGRAVEDALGASSRRWLSAMLCLRVAL